MKNNINFEKTRYLELLKKNNFLKLRGTCLYDQNSEEGLELLSYGVILEHQIYYSHKSEYIFFSKKVSKK